MKIVVTGGAGFVGSMLCRRAVEAGDEVVVVDDLSHGDRALVEGLGPSATLHVLDVRDGPALAALLERERPHAVIHLAALHFIPYCNEHPGETIDVNVGGTSSVFEACRRHPPAQVVFASTAAVYAPGDGPHVETETPRPMDIYGISKHAGEQLGRLYVAQTGAACIAARLFNAVGPNETNPHLVPALVDQLRAGATRVKLGNLEPKRDYIATVDLADALLALVRRRADGFEVFNVGTGTEVSVREVVALCGEILGRPIEIEQGAHLVRKVERMHLLASIDRLREATGWAPRVPLRETLRALLEGAPA